MAGGNLLIELGVNRGQTLQHLWFQATEDVRNPSLLKPLLASMERGGTFNTADWCYHGYEANPALTTELKALEAQLQGRCVHIHTETVAGTRAGKAPFYVDRRTGKKHGPDKPYWGEGSTMDPAAGRLLNQSVRVDVPTVDFSSELVAVVRNHRREHFGSRGRVILRMDIEGGEYSLLPHLLQPQQLQPTPSWGERREKPAAHGGPTSTSATAAICAADVLLIEFHARRMRAEQVDAHLSLRAQLSATCPNLRVLLDPSNYRQRPWADTWPVPPEWHGLIHGRAPLQGRGIQELSPVNSTPSVVTSKQPTVTIVTAFFELPASSSRSGEHGIATYRKWCASMLTQVRGAPFDITCNAAACAWLKPMRKDDSATVWRQYELSESNVVARYRLDMNTLPPLPAAAKQQPPERNLIMHEKLWILRHAAVANAFGTSHFLWVDSGMFRVTHPFKHWPDPARLRSLPDNRIIGTQVFPAVASMANAHLSLRRAALWKMDMNATVPSRTALMMYPRLYTSPVTFSIICGCTFGGAADAVVRLHNLYTKMLDVIHSEFGPQSLVLVVDQDIFVRLQLHTPSLWAVVPAPEQQWCHASSAPIVAAQSLGERLLVRHREECMGRTSKRSVSRPCPGAWKPWFHLLPWLARTEEVSEEACPRSGEPILLGGMEGS